MRRAALLAICGALALGACGGDSDDGGGGASTTASATQSSVSGDVDAAMRVQASDFPKPNGRTLQQMADSFGGAGPDVGLASSVLTTGVNRFAFGVVDRETGFLYGPTAVYIATGPDVPARGPYPAPADSLITEPPFRSQNAASEEDVFAAIYAARVPFPRAGRTAVLTVTNSGGRMHTTGVDVRVIRPARDEVARVGDPAPRVSTDTLASVAGNVEAIDTRVPPSDMHEVNFAEVVGRRPVALLFATPALCQSRVCGPVVDIALQLKAKYGDQIEFIHQEVYVDNEPAKGLRPPLVAFGLSTEPWLFTVDRTGRIAARLEGSFGLRAFEEAIQAALR
jgi:hypothetical protein